MRIDATLLDRVKEDARAEMREAVARGIARGWIKEPLQAGPGLEDGSPIKRTPSTKGKRRFLK